MNILKSFINRHHASSRWALLGGAMLWLSVSIAAPAHAVPTNYEILPGGFFSGTFTMDPTLTSNPFITWNIIPALSPAFFPGSTPSELNNGDGSTIADLHQFAPLSSPDLHFTTHILEFKYDAQYTPDNFLNTISGTGSYRVVDGQVPEPATTVLLAIGLLVLAGSRWLPGRRERQQLG